MKSPILSLVCASSILSLTAHAAIEVEGRSYEVVDMHIHAGTVGDLNKTGKAFVVNVIPEFTRLYYPAIANAAINPYAPHVGSLAQLEWAGIDHGVLLATYTHHTIGFLTNNALEDLLIQPGNVKEDGARWNWGLASINLDDFADEAIAQRRTEMMATYFSQRPDLFIGIKLAHAHQRVPFDDPNLLQVYDVAATFGVPVLLHTGMTPYEGGRNQPDYYDPISLESAIVNYDGESGNPRVEFILSHIGLGDARAVAHSLYLAEHYDNVWLELSAIGRPIEIDINGDPIESSEPMYVSVLRDIKEKELVGRTIFATDGPQSSGTIRAYSQELVQAMLDAGFTPDDLERVLAGNFYSCFFGERP
jgi:predicted TIM-barrel fold metal-dependent hydrolase